MSLRRSLPSSESSSSSRHLDIPMALHCSVSGPDALCVTVHYRMIAPVQALMLQLGDQRSSVQSPHPLSPSATNPPTLFSSFFPLFRSTTSSWHPLTTTSSTRLCFKPFKPLLARAFLLTSTGKGKAARGHTRDRAVEHIKS